MSRLATICLVFIAASLIEAKPRGGRRWGAPCGLPAFVDDLPADAQEKVNAIWKDYKEGDKCYEEQDKTREIIDALPKELRRSLHKRPQLSFLKGQPKDVVSQFDAIYKDKSITWADKQDKIDELAEKVLTGDALKKFKEYKAKKEKSEKEYKEKEEKLSKEAKEAHEKLEKLQKQKFEILGELTDDAKEELFDLWRSRPHFRSFH